MVETPHPSEKHIGKSLRNFQKKIRPFLCEAKYSGTIVPYQCYPLVSVVPYLRSVEAEGTAWLKEIGQWTNYRIHLTFRRHFRHTNRLLEIIATKLHIHLFLTDGRDVISFVKHLITGVPVQCNWYACYRWLVFCIFWAGGVTGMHV